MTTARLLSCLKRQSQLPKDSANGNGDLFVFAATGAYDRVLDRTGSIRLLSYPVLTRAALSLVYENDFVDTSGPVGSLLPSSCSLFVIYFALAVYGLRRILPRKLEKSGCKKRILCGLADRSVANTHRLGRSFPAGQCLSVALSVAVLDQSCNPPPPPSPIVSYTRILHCFVVVL